MVQNLSGRIFFQEEVEFLNRTSGFNFKPGFYIVVSGLSRSLLNLKFPQNCEQRYGNMNEFLQRPVATLKSSE